MTIYGQHENRRETPQTEPARADQAQNNAGGFSFELDKWKRLDRFLVLGAAGGTYYVGEKKLVKENAQCVRDCLAEDPYRTVARIVEISDGGRAPQNDPAIFALAMAAGDKSPSTRRLALSVMLRVCRIGTHLFHFLADVRSFRGFGPGLARAVGGWYTGRTPEQLALQVVKYQQRDKWSHRDALRLSHPKAKSQAQQAIIRWVVGGGSEALKETRKHGGPVEAELPALIHAFEAIHKATDPKEVIRLIVDHKLPHECVPNEWKDRPEVWEAMLDGMGQTAILRNLGKMTSVGLLKPMAEVTKRVAASIADQAALKKGRVHPIAVLLALTTYRSGHGVKGSLTWQPAGEVVDALDEAFYLAFSSIEPTGKNHLLALDVSGSMSSKIANTHLSCREASAAMAMVTARSEKSHHMMCFSTDFVPLPITARQRLDDVVQRISTLPFSGTDCALPMLYAAQRKIEVDTFSVFTDSETWAGTIHPFQALQRYREKMGRPAKLVVVGMTATNISIADPNDAGMLDVAGFDAATPQVLADFARD